MSRKKLRKGAQGPEHGPSGAPARRLRGRVDWQRRQPALLHLAQGAAAGSRVEPFPVQTAVGSAQKQSILASPMALRGSGGGRRFE